MRGMLIPWRSGLPRLRHDFLGEMDELFERLFSPEGRDDLAKVASPRVNVAETESQYEITVDLPGVNPADVAVEHKPGELWISGERKEEKEEKDKTFHRIERHVGRFHRVIPLVADIDADKIEAAYKDGVLRITVPKAEAARPRRIEVTT